MNVAVHEADARGAFGENLRERAGEVYGNRAFANAALAGRDGDLELHAGKRVFLGVFRGRLVGGVRLEQNDFKTLSREILVQNFRSFFDNVSPPVNMRTSAESPSALTYFTMPKATMSFW